MRSVALAFLLILSLSACGGSDAPDEEQTMAGVTVTAEVPHSTETIADIINRCDDNTIGDRAVPYHPIDH